MGDGLRLMEKYYPVLSDTARLQLHMDGEWARVTLASIAPVPTFSRQVNEWTLAAWVTGLRMYAGENYNPLQARFANARPNNTTEQDRVFRSPLGFDFPHTELILRTEDLEIPHPTGEGDPSLVLMLEQHASGQIERASHADPFLMDLRKELLARLDGKELALSDVAGGLGMSERTLQRKLQSYNSTFSELLESLRKEIAADLLRDIRIGVKEISLKLGFSSTSAFYKAFHRWYKTTPAEFRRMLTSPSTLEESPPN